jgi:hypothetical protein
VASQDFLRAERERRAACPFTGRNTKQSGDIKIPIGTARRICVCAYCNEGLGTLIRLTRTSTASVYTTKKMKLPLSGNDERRTIEESSKSNAFTSGPKEEEGAVEGLKLSRLYTVGCFLERYASSNGTALDDNNSYMLNLQIVL